MQFFLPFLLLVSLFFPFLSLSDGKVTLHISILYFFAIDSTPGIIGGEKRNVALSKYVYSLITCNYRRASNNVRRSKRLQLSLLEPESDSVDSESESESVSPETESVELEVIDKIVEWLSVKLNCRVEETISDVSVASKLPVVSKLVVAYVSELVGYVLWSIPGSLGGLPSTIGTNLICNAMVVIGSAKRFNFMFVIRCRAFRVQVGNV